MNTKPLRIILLATIYIYCALYDVMAGLTYKFDYDKRPLVHYMRETYQGKTWPVAIFYNFNWPMIPQKPVQLLQPF